MFDSWKNAAFARRLALLVVGGAAASAFAADDGPLLIDPQNTSYSSTTTTDKEETNEPDGPLLFPSAATDQPTLAPADVVSSARSESEALPQDEVERLQGQVDAVIEEAEAAQVDYETPDQRPLRETAPRDVAPEELPPPKPKSVLARPLQPKSTPADVTYLDRLGMTVTETGGALQVSRVVADSVAEAAGLRRGDIVVSYAGWPITSAKEFKSLLARTTSLPQAAITVERSGSPRRSVLEFERQASRDWLTGVESSENARATYYRSSTGYDSHVGAAPPPPDAPQRAYGYYESDLYRPSVTSSRLAPVEEEARERRLIRRPGLLGRLRRR